MIMNLIVFTYTSECLKIKKLIKLNYFAKKCFFHSYVLYVTLFSITGNKTEQCRIYEIMADRG